LLVSDRTVVRRSRGFADDARDLVTRAQEYERRGAGVEAGVAYDMALALVDGAPAGPFHADLFRWKGTLLQELGDAIGAEALYRRSLEVSQYIQYARGVAHAQTRLGMMLMHRRDWEQAAELLEEARIHAAEGQDAPLLVEVLRTLGTSWLERRDPDRARVVWREALGICRTIGAAPDIDDLERRLATLARARRDS
jgi:tetratricopeptide (TPR) repeat protein